MTDQRTDAADHSRKPRFDVVSREISAPPERVFDVLTDPSRHPGLDDSGMVLELLDGDRLTEVGQVFRMRMTMGGANRYETDNRVVAFEPGRTIAWTTAEADHEPLGWLWRYDLEPTPAGTLVSQTYDWSGVTDKETLQMIPFPAVPRDARLETLELLAQATES
ncbi:SRPBCC family protein [Terracoccus luteus]|uniref:Polyketide cyclase/dehydrase/lipid transport protein n=1 Tax=Terracoccus luteus TaxID=53356 RepID=A0A495XSS2_9MICO|nr:SRPBCC family protein [Terracoccus luteus]MBB2988076.1 uncharacterized protein YndB with AHSA1/START domain [Terracoccus luteus]MCP2173727.1 uncharacterized protein YndB with AHSA1/START domain [Terracoccus luteus]RKT76629.1 polyketide cyclase/dehydrase/lipid transport protein [Terracoccus luteus]